MRLDKLFYIHDIDEIRSFKEQNHFVLINPNSVSIKAITPNRQTGLSTMAALNVCAKILTSKKPRHVVIYSESFDLYKQLFKLNLWNEIKTIGINYISLNDGSRIDFYSCKSKLNDNHLRGILYDLLVIDSYHNHDFDKENAKFNEIIHIATGVNFE